MAKYRYVVFVRITVDGEKRGWRMEILTEDLEMAQETASEASEHESSENVRLIDLDEEPDHSARVWWPFVQADPVPDPSAQVQRAIDLVYNLLEETADDALVQLRKIAGEGVQCERVEGVGGGGWPLVRLSGTERDVTAALTAWYATPLPLQRPMEGDPARS